MITFPIISTLGRGYSSSQQIFTASVVSFEEVEGL